MKTLFALLVSGACALTATASAQAATKMRCSHQLPPGHHIAKVIDRWAAEVESASNNEIDVQVFGANSLVGARENIVSTAKGDIECAFSVNFQWGRTLPIMNVTVAPFAHDLVSSPAVGGALVPLSQLLGAEGPDSARSFINSKVLPNQSAGVSKREAGFSRPYLEPALRQPAAYLAFVGRMSAGGML